MKLLLITFVAIMLCLLNSVYAAESICPGGSNPRSDVIWCSDFESYNNPACLSNPKSAACWQANGWSTTGPSFGGNGGGILYDANAAVGNGIVKGVGSWGSNGLGYVSQGFTPSNGISYRYYVKFHPGYMSYQFDHGPGIKLDGDHCAAEGLLEQSPYNYHLPNGLSGYGDVCPVPSGQPTLFGQVDLENNRWYLIEMQKIIDTSCINTSNPLGCNGIVRMWVDGVLQMEQKYLNMGGVLDNVRFDGVWGPRSYFHHRIPNTNHGISYDNFIISTKVNCGSDGKIPCIGPATNENPRGTPDPASPYFVYEGIEPFALNPAYPGSDCPTRTPAGDCVSNCGSRRYGASRGKVWPTSAAVPNDITTFQSSIHHGLYLDKCPNALTDGAMKVSLPGANAGGIYWNRDDNGYLWPHHVINGWMYFASGNDYSTNPALAGFVGYDGVNDGKYLALTIKDGKFALVSKKSASAAPVVFKTSSVTMQTGRWYNFEIKISNDNTASLMIDNVAVISHEPHQMQAGWFFNDDQTITRSPRVVVGVIKYTDSEPFTVYYDDLQVGTASFWNCEGWGNYCPWSTQTCSCTAWTNDVCDGGSCNATQMRQTRTCTPSGCDIQERCVADTSCSPAPTCTDNDGDKYNITGGSCGPIDCNDNNAAVYPGAPELCSDSLDNDCDGTINEFCTCPPGTSCTTSEDCTGVCASDGITCNDVPDDNCPVQGNYTVTITNVQDTFININHDKNSQSADLNLYTWPENKIANAILLKWDLSQIPANAEITNAQLKLYMYKVLSTGGDALYDVSVHKIINKNPVISQADGYVYDGTNGWTPSSCCYNGIPMAQSDITTTIDTKHIDKTYGFKTWTVTQIVADWISGTPNYGMLVNSDATATSNSNRVFASKEHTNTQWRPQLVVTYIIGGTGEEPPCDDNDGDGYFPVSCGGSDCNDNNAAINPDASEICGNSVDENCDLIDLTCPICPQGQITFRCKCGSSSYDSGYCCENQWRPDQCPVACPDNDHDNYTDATCGGTDCNDANPLINPAAAEICNQIDDNCNGIIDDASDVDGDGFNVCEGDCNDANSSISPQSNEKCNNIDDDCDTLIDEGFDVDADGYTTCEGDCNDGNPTINPGTQEICGNTVDENCDGIADACGPWCGNGIVDSGETCSNCPQDVICSDTELCCSSACVEPQCFTDADCDDNNNRTRDRCRKSGQCNAYCQHTPDRPKLLIKTQFAVEEGKTFVAKVIDENNNPVSGSTVQYQGETKLTDERGEVSFVARANYADISAVKDLFESTFVRIEVIDLPDDVCGDNICGTNENEVSCSEDCLSLGRPVPEIFVETSESVVVGENFEVTVRDAKGMVMPFVDVIYGSQTTKTNMFGVASFVGQADARYVLAQDYGRKSDMMFVTPIVGQGFTLPIPTSTMIIIVAAILIFAFAHVVIGRIK